MVFIAELLNLSDIKGVRKKTRNDPNTPRIRRIIIVWIRIPFFSCLDIFGKKYNKLAGIPAEKI